MSLRSWLLLYFTLLSALAFFMFGLDKYKAAHNKWRISERALFTVSILGGACGSYLAMRLFHHKTQKPGFRFWIPVLAFIDLIGLGIAFLWH